MHIATRPNGKLSLVGTIVLGLTAWPAGAANPGGTSASSDAHLDAHALGTPAHAEVSLDRLVEHVTRAASSDRDKARAIFRWLTDRIRFDVDALLTSHPGLLRPDEVLRERRATSFGYAALFEALAQRAGLEALTIVGQVKGVSPTDDEHFQRINHAWNAVKIDGRWQLLDATRGAGYVKGQRFHKVFQEQYFLAPPEQFVRTHLPADPRWQFLHVPVTPQQFEALPYAKARYVGAGLKQEAVWQRYPIPGPNPAVYRHTAIGAEAYLYAGQVKILAAPPLGKLPRGHDYYFLFEAPQASEMAFVQKDRCLFLQKTGTRFEGMIRPEPGELKLGLKRHPHDQLFQAVRTYQIDQ
jgi:hypothetical protein